MARGKHSPALFEVVHGRKHQDKETRTGALRTPNWWFKGRRRVEIPVPVSVPDEPPEFAEFENDPTQQPSAALAAPERDPTYPDSTAEEVVPFSMPGARRRTSFQFVLDRDRHELYVRVRYTTAIVAGFGVLVLLGLAYVTGRHTGRGPSSALASQSSEEVAAGPVDKGVLDLTRPTSTSAKTTGSNGFNPGGVSAQPAPGRSGETVVVPPAGGGPTRPAGPGVEPKTLPPDNGRRTVGRQYVVIQSYPADQKKLADEAADFLVKSGIPCTVEKGVSGWPSTWHNVVGTQPFERASGPQYDAYITSITKLGEKFAGRSAWKRFEPQAVRWKEVN